MRTRSYYLNAYIVFIFLEVDRYLLDRYGLAIGLIAFTESYQIYHHVKEGWLVICILIAILFFIALVLTFAFTGEVPVLKRLHKSRLHRSAS